MSLDDYQISYPTEYNNDWLLFHNAIFTDLGMSDCNDTINGKCEDVENAEQCADICVNDPTKQCFVGYYVKDDKKSYCVPLRTNIEKQTLYYERLRNKNIYPSLENAKTTVFIKRNKTFPPNRANVVFYKDKFLLQNADTELNIISDDQGNVKAEKGEFYLRFLPHGLVLRNNEENYIPVEYDTKVVINIPQTNLNLEQEQDGNLLQWIKSSNNIGTFENVFYIRRLSAFDYPNDDTPWSKNYLNYQDEFYLETSLGSVLCIDDLNIPFLKYGNVEAMSKYRFRLIPDVNVYCGGGIANNEINFEDTSCNEYSLKDTDMNGIESTKNGETCYRQPNCWRFNRISHVEGISVGVLIFILIIIIIIILYRMLKK
jgi:hypothetical protein